MAIGLHKSDNRTLMKKEKRGEDKVRWKKRKRRGSRGETSFVFFLFASCKRYYVGSYCVMVIVMLSVDD